MNTSTSSPMPADTPSGAPSSSASSGSSSGDGLPSRLRSPQSSLWFDKYDRAMMNVLLPALGAVVLGVSVYRAVINWVGDRSYELSVGAIQLGADVPSFDRSGLTYDLVSSNFTIDDPGLAVLALDSLAALMFGVGVAAGCWFVFQVMNSIAAGNAFQHNNVRRVRWLSGAIYLAGVGAPVAGWLGKSIAGSTVIDALEPDQFIIGFPVLTVFLAVAVGTTVAMLAQAFGIGEQLVDDVEGTI